MCRRRSAVIVILTLSFVTCSEHAFPKTIRTENTFSAIVSEVLRGDAFIVKHKEETIKVYLYGIQCPGPTNLYGIRATAYTKTRIDGQEIRINVRRRQSESIIRAIVYFKKDECLNDDLLNAGLASWNQQEAPNDNHYKQIQDMAMSSKSGIWSKPPVTKSSQSNTAPTVGADDSLGTSIKPPHEIIRKAKTSVDKSNTGRNETSAQPGVEQPDAQEAPLPSSELQLEKPAQVETHTITPDTVNEKTASSSRAPVNRSNQPNTSRTSSVNPPVNIHWLTISIIVLWVIGTIWLCITYNRVKFSSKTYQTWHIYSYQTTESMRLANPTIEYIFFITADLLFIPFFFRPVNNSILIMLLFANILCNCPAAVFSFLGPFSEYKLGDLYYHREMISSRKLDRPTIDTAGPLLLLHIIPMLCLIALSNRTFMFFLFILLEISLFLLIARITDPIIKKRASRVDVDAVCRAQKLLVCAYKDFHANSSSKISLENLLWMSRSPDTGSSVYWAITDAINCHGERTKVDAHSWLINPDENAGSGIRHRDLHDYSGLGYVINEPDFWQFLGTVAKSFAEAKPSA
ncbi:MAG TPA: thermonuclease family protein [Candidatus Hydrogenedentes bacterium]|nr:thermonuclease family protein [Candidatus Hydrogenedentota bacterium]